MNTEAIRDNRWFVIVNPNAGKRKGEKDWPEISALLTEAGFDYSYEFTSHRDHAITLTRKYIEDGYRRIIVVGGDGTLNEVINGIFGQETVKTTDITVGMIMVGTGNDWGRMYHLKQEYKKAVKILKKERLFLQDTGIVRFSEGTEPKERYFVNIAGLGYDALVVQMTNHTKDRGGGGPLTYLVNLLKGLFRYRDNTLEVEIDGTQAYKGRVFSMSVGICKYNGGGMMQLPFAIPDDGIFDVTIFKNVTKTTVVRHIKKLYSGKFTHLPFVGTYQGKSVTIRSISRDPAYLETDGESLGHSPFTFELIPKSLKIITGKKWKEKEISSPDENI